MAFNNGFYQNYYPQQNNTFNNGIIWVQGEAGAKSYLVAPNTTVQLWDSEKQIIYLKSADASGMPTMKILDYTIRENQNAPVVELNESEYVTKKELTDLKNQIEELKKQIEKGDEVESII